MKYLNAISISRAPALTLTLAVTLVACAGAPKKTVNVPTYTEKAKPLDLNAVTDGCPANVGAMSKSGTDWRALIGPANACVKAAQWNKVEALGNRIATAAPLVPWGSYYLSLSAAARKDFARAQWMLELSLKKAPDQAIFHYQLARVYADLDDDSGVIREMKTAAGLAADLTDAHAYLGQLALRRADLGEARRELKTALATEPAHGAALLSLAQVELLARDYAAAEDILLKVIKVQPRNTEARLALADVQETQLRKTAEALGTLRELRELAGARKLDGTTPHDLGERILNLEKSLAQVQNEGKVSKRVPTGERQITK